VGETPALTAAGTAAIRYLVCALVPLGTSWEAGEMPALPRNCKREVLRSGHCERSREGRRVVVLASQETGAHRSINPFRV